MHAHECDVSGESCGRDTYAGIVLDTLCDYWASRKLPFI